MYSVMLLSMDRCCSSCSMYVPLVLQFVMLFSYHAALLSIEVITNDKIRYLSYLMWWWKLSAGYRIYWGDVNFNKVYVLFEACIDFEGLYLCCFEALL